MKNTLSTSEAASLLMADDNAAWSMAGAFALEQVEEDCGTEIEFDRVAIRCEYSEHESLQGWAETWCESCQYAGALDPADAIRDFIQDRGQLIEFDGGIIVSEF